LLPLIVQFFSVKRPWFRMPLPIPARLLLIVLFRPKISAEDPQLFDIMHVPEERPSKASPLAG
jgi:hypothetical protein